jgi:hypothetical protein
MERNAERLSELCASVVNNPARLLDSFQKGELGSVIEIEPRQIGRSSDGSSRYREPFLTAYSGIMQNSG